MPIVISMKEDLKEVIEIKEGVTAGLDQNTLKLKGPQGEVERLFNDPHIDIKIDNQNIVLSVKNATKREKKMLKTYVAHINNLINGVKDKFIYRLKICASHFPMNVSLSGNQFIVKNFLGEKSPRTMTVKKGVEVKINGDIIEVSSCNKERAGNVASDMELLTKKVGKDVRIFQDGIYIIEKGGKSVL